MVVQIKRIYEEPDSGDGYRVLVDRMWPRGVSKKRAQLDQWLKDVAPSSELRTWFNHVESRWPEFRDRYVEELERNGAVRELREIAANHSVLTLLYSARDEIHNQAVVLRDYV